MPIFLSSRFNLKLPPKCSHCSWFLFKRKIWNKYQILKIHKACNTVRHILSSTNIVRSLSRDIVQHFVGTLGNHRPSIRVKTQLENPTQVYNRWFLIWYIRMNISALYKLSNDMRPNAGNEINNVNDMKFVQNYAKKTVISQVVKQAS